MTGAWPIVPDASIVRILGTDGIPVGVGVLVGDRRVLTCAHVVNVALGRPARDQSLPSALLSLDLPLSPGGVTGRPLSAKVTRWLPPPMEGVAGDDIAGLDLMDEPPASATIARLAQTLPAADTRLEIFGFPAGRPDGVRAPAIMRGLVGGGRLQIDGDSGAAWQAEPGFSGSPVVDPATGRVAALLAVTATGAPQTMPRDAYAISSERLRLAWPEVLGLRGSRRSGAPMSSIGAQMRAGFDVQAGASITVLHLSDLQFGRYHLFGGNGLTTQDAAFDSLFHRLHDDLALLEREQGLRPDLAVVSGDLAEWGLASEYERVHEFLVALSEGVELPRSRIAIVPGNHDVNRKACEAYFTESESEERDPVRPYWPKWRHFSRVFEQFYSDAPSVSFTPDQPWTLFEIPELSVVIAGLNSTMAESHLDADHYGWLGEAQIRWFADKLAGYRDRGWLRLGVVHHNAVRGAELDDENLRDTDDLDRYLGRGQVINMLLHGHTHNGRTSRLSSGVLALSTGSAAVDLAARPNEVPNQYQLLTIDREGVTRYARQYAPAERRWIGDTRVSSSGSDWRARDSFAFSSVDSGLPPAEGESGESPSSSTIEAVALWNEPRKDSFLGRLAEATRARFPGATVVPIEITSPNCTYLRVSHQVEGVTSVWPVGAVEGGLTEDELDTFCRRVHNVFATADPTVPSEIVCSGPPPSMQLTARARRAGLRRASSFVEYQGLVDLRPVLELQSQRLLNDPLYPSRLYVTQRYHLIGTGSAQDARDNALAKVSQWIAEEDAKFMVVLGPSGSGKTCLLRQLARELPAQLPRVPPLLVELRSVEKSSSLHELLAQQLFHLGLEDLSPRKLEYMVRSGRVCVILDGFDELEMRVGYDSAADYLKTLLTATKDQAKVVLSSRTQHFKSNEQLLTALGSRVAGVGVGRIIELDEFDPSQIGEFLTKYYSGNTEQAEARYGLIRGVEDLISLSGNPRVLAFIASLSDEAIQAMKSEIGGLSVWRLYSELISSWLTSEASREIRQLGRPSLEVAEKLSVCAALARLLWLSGRKSIPVDELPSRVADALGELATLYPNMEHLGHAVGTSTLLLRDADGGFSFAHPSVMEWFIAHDICPDLATEDNPELLGVRRVSQLVIDFLIDASTPSACYAWAARTLSDIDAQPAAKANALSMRDRLAERTPSASASVNSPQSLAGVDLRSQSLDGTDLRCADMRGADLRGMRLTGVDLSGANLSRARLDGARLVGGSIESATLNDSSWRRAILMGVRGVESSDHSSALTAAAVVGRDTVEVMVAASGGTQAVAMMPGDPSLCAIAKGSAVQILDLELRQTIRVLIGHTDTVTAVAYSSDGTRLASASRDRSVRIWDAESGACIGLLSGHTDRVTGVAFEPSGARLATSSWDRTVKIWDTSIGSAIAELAGHTGWVNSIVYSPDGSTLASASDDGTVRVWDARQGSPLRRLTGHSGAVTSVSYSPNGSYLASAGEDRTVRVWDVAAFTTSAILSGHLATVTSVAYSPDGLRLASASDDRTVRVWDPLRGSCLGSTADGAFTRRVTDVVYSQDGKCIVGTSWDESVHIWDANTLAEAASIRGATRRISAVAYSGDGASLAACGHERLVRVWDVATGTVRQVFEASGEPVNQVCFSPNGDILAACDGEGTVWAWSTRTGEESKRLPAHMSGVLDLAFDPSGEYLATASSDGTGAIWSVRSWERLVELRGHEGPVKAVAFLPGEERIITAGEDRTIRIWDLADLGSPSRIAGDPQAKVVAGHTGAINSLACRPDGTEFATGSEDQTVRIWGASTGSAVATLTGHTRPVTSVRYSADGGRLASTSWDRTVRIWNASTGKQEASFGGHASVAACAAFAPHGARMASASHDGTIALWDSSTGQRLARLIPLSGDGFGTLLPEGSFKLRGEPADVIWFAIKLCRLGIGEIAPYSTALRWLAESAPI